MLYICSHIIDKPFVGLFEDRVADLSQKWIWGAQHSIKQFMRCEKVLLEIFSAAKEEWEGMMSSTGASEEFLSGLIPYD